jgi:Ca-activated chloride channel family protein
MVIALMAMAQLRKRNIAKFGNPSTLAALMPDLSSVRKRIKSSLFLLAVTAVIFAAARPQFGSKLKEQTSQGVEMMLVVDISNSMLAEDFAPNRLDRTRYAIDKLFASLNQDRVGMVVFAGEAKVQLPITTDYRMARSFTKRVSPTLVSVQGTEIGQALNLASLSFSQNRDAGRAIILITDGENHEDDPIEAAEQAAEMGIKIFTIGVGSPEGKPIPMDGELLRDKEGNIVVTRLDESVLQQVAYAGNGVYVRAGNSEFGLNPIIEDIRKMEDEKYSSIVFEEYDEQFMYFLAIALLFFVVEMLVGDRRSKRHLFNR